MDEADVGGWEDIQKRIREIARSEGHPPSDVTRIPPTFSSSGVGLEGFVRIRFTDRYCDFDEDIFKDISDGAMEMLVRAEIRQAFK